MKQINYNQWIIEILKNNKTEELLITFPNGAIDQVGWEKNNSDELIVT